MTANIHTIAVAVTCLTITGIVAYLTGKLLGRYSAKIYAAICGRGGEWLDLKTSTENDHG
jgi:hypothetical protein